MAEALMFAKENLPGGPILIHSSASPEEVLKAQTHLGKDRAAEITEGSLSAIAEGLVGLGCRQLIVAGGETSGAVVRRLGITTARVGKEVTPCAMAENRNRHRVVHPSQIRKPRRPAALP